MAELINMIEAMDKVNHTMSTWVQEADDRLKVLEIRAGVVR